MTDTTFTIQCFGAFRNITDTIRITTPAMPTVQTIKQAVIDAIGGEHQALVNSSVLATDTTILRDTDTIEKPIQLWILPPVCGG